MREPGWMESYERVRTLLQDMTKSELDKLLEQLVQLEKNHPSTKDEAFFTELQETIAKFKNRDYRSTED